MSRILILHDHTDYFDQLVACFPAEQYPTLEWRVCNDTTSVQNALANWHPDVIFSVHTAAIPMALQHQLMKLPSIKWIHIGGAGIDWVPSPAELNVPVCNAAGVLSAYMAEVVIGAAIMMNFRFHTYIRQQPQRLWQPQPWTSLQGKTAVVVGLGNIGRKVAAHLTHFGVHVIGVMNTPRNYPAIPELITRKQLLDTLPRADFVCLHVPHTPQTDKLIGSAELAAMPPHAILINTARGGVVDEQALIAALQTQAIAGAYLDVFEVEPLPVESPLWSLKNVVISPHYADSIETWRRDFALHFADNLERWLNGQPLLNVVDPSRGY